MNKVSSAGESQRIQAWVSSSQQNPFMGILPADTYVSQVHCHVTEAFNSSTTDEITVGYDADVDAFATTIDSSSTGVKSVNLGVLNGYNSVARKVEAYYVNGGTEPSTGKAFIWIETIKVPTSP